jgi:hypothetical protein
MDLTAYLLSRAVWATAPAGETGPEAQARAEAIAAMLRAYAPREGVEAMMACQCIMMQFVLDAAMRDAGNPRQEPAAQEKARAGAISASRTLHQWVTKFENYRKRNERRAVETNKTPAAIPAADPPVQTPRVQTPPVQRPPVQTSPAQTPRVQTPPVQTPPDGPGTQQAASPSRGSPEPNGLIASPLPPIAAGVRLAASGVGFAGSGARNGPPPSLPAVPSRAA